MDNDDRIGQYMHYIWNNANNEVVDKNYMSKNKKEIKELNKNFIVLDF